LALTDLSNMPRPWEVKDGFDLVTTDFVYVRWLGDRKGIEALTTTWDKSVIDRTDTCGPNRSAFAFPKMDIRRNRATPQLPLLIGQNCAVVTGDMAGGIIAALHFSNFPERRYRGLSDVESEETRAIRLTLTVV